MTQLRLLLVAATALIVTACGGAVPNALSTLTQEPEEQYTPNDVPIATLLYVGFGFEQSPPFESIGGLGTTGWNIIGGNPPVLWSGLTVTEPEIGWYKSKDVTTIDWQLKQMQRAGINVVFLSWQGWGDDNLDGVIEPSINVEYDATAKMVLDHIKTNNLPFKFAILCEDFPGNYHGISLLDLTDAQRRMVMDHLWENYYSPEAYGDMAFHWNGKPLIAGGANTPGQWWGRMSSSTPGLSFERFTTSQRLRTNIGQRLITPILPQSCRDQKEWQ